MNSATDKDKELQKTQPIKRSKMLVPLSRDHHEGLLLCWKIRHGLSNEIDEGRIVKYVLWFFENELRDHFRQEEELLFSLLKEGDQNRKEVVAQHELLYGMIASFSTIGIDTKILLRQFSANLEEHIRYEERVLFPYIENTVPEPDLLKAGEQISTAHSKHDKNIWDDQFWLKK